MQNTDEESAWSGYVYPNPSEGGFSIRMVSDEAGEVQLSLLNIQGKAVEACAIQVLEGVSVAEFDFSNLSSGIYF